MDRNARRKIRVIRMVTISPYRKCQSDDSSVWQEGKNDLTKATAKGRDVRQSKSLQGISYGKERSS